MANLKSIQFLYWEGKIKQNIVTELSSYDVLLKVFSGLMKFFSGTPR